MNSDLFRYLSKRDLCGLLDLSHQSLSCTDEGAFKRLVLELRNLFCFEAAVCAYGNIDTALSQSVPQIELLDISYPAGYLERYFKKKYHQTDAVVTEFLRTLKPVNWHRLDCGLGVRYPASVTAEEFGMIDGWTDGVLEPDSLNCSVFFFGDASYMEGHRRTACILEYIIPFYTEAFKRLVREETQAKIQLTPKEIEVINWIKEGKSSWEISVIMRCSKRVVDFHVANLKQKLSAVSRSQAVAIALHRKLISF